MTRFRYILSFVPIGTYLVSILLSSSPLAEEVTSQSDPADQTQLSRGEESAGSASDQAAPSEHSGQVRTQEANGTANITDQAQSPAHTAPEEIVESGPTEDPALLEPSSYISLKGRIWRVNSGFVFAKTPVGTMTLFSEKGLRKVKSGQRIRLRSHEHTLVVDIHKKGESTPLRRFITGIPVYTSPEHQAIQFWTPEGGQTLQVGKDGSEFANAREGSPITVQLDQSGEVVGLSRLNVDIQITDSTTARPGAKMKLAGTVLRVKAGFAFVETPVGILVLGKKSGFQNPRAGQEVMVWMNEDHLVIDVKQKEDSSPSERYITSKVVYASEDRTEIRLWTPEGEKTLPLPARKKKRSAFRPGTPVTVQLNGNGEVIAVRKAG